MKPHRVLHVLRSVEGGVPVVADHLVNGLDRKRYEPIVLFDTHHQSEIRNKLLLSDIKTIEFKKCVENQTFSSAKPCKNLDIKRRLEANFGKEASKIYLSVKKLSKFFLKQAPRIKSYVRALLENRIDLVHTHSDLSICKPEIIASRISGVPCISHNHSCRELTYFDKVFTRFVDTFIYISSYVAEYHTNQGTRFKGRIIHNGIDINRFTQSYDSDSVREEFGIKSDQPLIGIIGRIDWWKGHEYFLEAIAKVVKQVPSLRGLIVGPRENNVMSTLDRNRRYFKKLELMVGSLGLSDKIIFTGSRNDVPRLISALDVVVHASSVPEPFGLVIVEGMAAGKPVVAAAAGGVLDIIEDGVNGLLVPLRDAGAMARAILEIISNPDKAKQMGLDACQHVTEKFTFQKQVKAVEKLYDEILADPKRKKRVRS